jgi:hypothetical protein
MVRDSRPLRARGRLDRRKGSGEDEIISAMRLQPFAAACLAIALLSAMQIFLAPSKARQQGKTQTPPTPTSRVTIEVSGGEPETPVENASVYIKYVEERKIRKDKKLELNVKTNREGTAHVPDAPLGRVLIQVVADGWKTYGRWYDITDPKQVIKVHLEKPPRWY